MVSDDDGDLVATLQLPQGSEDGCHVVDLVLVRAMEADEGIEQQHSRPVVADGGVETIHVTLEVEAQRRDRDHVDIELVQAVASVFAERLESLADDIPPLLGEIDECRSRVTYIEGVEAGRPGGDTDGHFETEPGLERLRRTANEPHRPVSPQRLDEPSVSGGPGVEVRRPAHRE
jgi:hypothetical protein